MTTFEDYSFPASKKMKTPITLFLTFVALASCSDSLELEKHYQTRDMAKADGAFKRGWLPKWLPDNATNIYERHNLDTNASAISFHAAKSGPADLQLTCKPVSNPHKPMIELRTFPPDIQKHGNIRVCDGYYVFRRNDITFAWHNPVAEPF